MQQVVIPTTGKNLEPVSVGEMKQKDLYYIYDKDTAGFMRRKAGKGFVYLDQNNKPIKDEKTLERVKKLVIPPAWRNVWICPDEFGHIQATGIDEKGRKQYLYHQLWNELQQEHKFNKMLFFADVLPEIREQIEKDIYLPGLSKRRVVATIVWLLEHTFIRIGNQEYARDNKSYGLTTLRDKHADIEKDHVMFAFRGKSGVEHEISFSHSQVARTIKACQDIPGYELFQYYDVNRKRQQIHSDDVNEYLKEITGEQITAKDFRTWGGTMLSAVMLYSIGPFTSQKAAKKNVTQAVKAAAKHLGNKPSTCRSYYIHPFVPESYLTEQLIPHFQEIVPAYNRDREKLNLHEFAVVSLLKKYEKKS